MEQIIKEKDLIKEIREKFCHVEECPYSGKRIFFENAGGSLTLKSVVDRSALMAAIPDNQGRDNEASSSIMNIISKSKLKTLDFFNTENGSIIVGESGTELLFRLIRTAILSSDKGSVVGSTLEHPASRSATAKWSKIASKELIMVPHCNETGTLDIERYIDQINSEVVVATVVHTSPVTGIGVDLKNLTKGIKEKNPNCLVIVDGIQHAAHGNINISDYKIDGYVISPYKVFSRHGYGLAWMSDKLRNLSHENLMNGPEENWELGTRDVGSYATFSDVVDYFEWLGSKLSTTQNTSFEKLFNASKFIHKQEQNLTEVMLHGKDNIKGLSSFQNIKIIGGIENELREGLVSFSLPDLPSEAIVKGLNEKGIRTHIRKSDHYSGNILEPLGLKNCVRVSMCHYNTEEEVLQFLTSMNEIGHI